MASPNNNRAYTLLKRYHYFYDPVERREQRNITRDYCNFADVIAYRPLTGKDLTQFPCLLEPGSPSLTGCLALQLCSYTGLAEHIRKLTSGSAAQSVLAWLQSGNRLEIWAFPAVSNKNKSGKYPPKFIGLTCHHDDIHITRDITELQLFGYTDSRLDALQLTPQT